MLNNCKILVTGCAGFIGSSLCDRLLSLGYEVVGVDNYSTGQRRFLDIAFSQPNFKFHLIDLLDLPKLKKCFVGADFIIHLAANADVRFGTEHPRKDLEQNTLATYNVLEAMRVADVRRIIFASSAAVLGEPKMFPTPEDCPIPAQTSLYGASKMACEGLISAYCEGYEFEGYVFRFVSLLGPRYPHGHVFDFVRSLRADPQNLTILGDGQQCKSYLHIDDCLNALMHVCETMRTARDAKHRYEVYHLGFPEYCRVEQSAGWICDQLRVEPKIEFTGGTRGWIGDNPIVFLDVRKAMATGWSPRYGIEQSIRETTRWLSDNAWIFDTRK